MICYFIHILESHFVFVNHSQLRSNPQLLEKGLRAMIKLPSFLNFDVKRSW